MNQATFQLITLNDAKDHIAKQYFANIVDIRDADSYDEGHIADAINLCADRLVDFCASADKSLPMLVYCYRGNSSKAAAAYLVSQGFQHVFSLEGGYAAWATQA